MRVHLPELNIQSSGALDIAHKSSFLVGGVSVQLSGNLQNDVALGPALLPFHFGGETPNILIQVERSENLMPSSSRDLLFDSGSVWRLYRAGDALQFDFSSSVLGDGPYKRLLVDNRFTNAMLSLSHTSFSDRSPAAPVEYPLDELLIMHRLTQERAIELHGAGIVRANGESNLFVGHSGAGKSTTTRLWTSREEVTVLSDDRIIVRPDMVGEDHGETPFRSGDGAGGLGVLRLRDGSASRNHHSAQGDNVKKHLGRDDNTKPGPMRMYGTPWHGEAMFALPNSAPLTRIFILEHGQGNVITRLTRSQAVGELFARSFVPFHRHEYVDSALSFLEQLADSVPCYRYSFEPDQRAVDKIIHFHD